jgi:hypothetical protein
MLSKKKKTDVYLNYDVKKREEKKTYVRARFESEKERERTSTR